MASHMKTTVHIPDSLIKEAKLVADREGITLKILIEEGLREAIAKRAKAKKFRLRKASFSGKGLQPPFEGAGWEQVRAAAYEDHGS